MSGTLPAFTFQNSDRVDIRRFCGYPPFGTGVVVFPEPWFWRYYLALETRISNLVSDEAQVILARLAELRILETAIAASGGNLDTDRAAVWYHNKNEVKDRLALYRTCRVKLCEIIGIPPGPHLGGGGNTMRIRV